MSPEVPPPLGDADHVMERLKAAMLGGGEWGSQGWEPAGARTETSGELPGPPVVQDSPHIRPRTIIITIINIISLSPLPSSPPPQPSPPPPSLAISHITIIITTGVGLNRLLWDQSVLMVVLMGPVADIL